MSLFSEKLASLRPGSEIRFTQKNGQTIDGIVQENDGVESFSVRVTQLITLRYDQIGAIQENQTESNQVVPQQELPSEAPTEKPAPIEIMKVVCDKNTLSQRFKEIDESKKRALNSAYNKCQSFLKSQDLSKCEEALNLIWNVMSEKAWEYDPQINMFYATVALWGKSISTAIDSFFYGNDTRSAYCVAYQYAEADDDMDLYRTAAVFSAIHLIENTEHLAEAAEVLKLSSEKLKDLSGMKRILKHSPSDQTQTELIRVIRELGQSHGAVFTDCENVGDFLDVVIPHYSGNEIFEKISDYIEEPQEESECEPETEPTPEPKNENETPDLKKDYTGRIVSYNLFETKGVIEANETDGGAKYPFDLKDITDQSLSAQIRKMTSKTFEPIYVKFNLIGCNGKYDAIKIKRGTEPVKAAPPVQAQPIDTIAKANSLYSQKRLTEALEIYQKFLDSKDKEHATAQIIQCYMALWNESGDDTYNEKIAALIEASEEWSGKSFKILEISYQYYMKVQNYAECIRIMNMLMELCGPDDLGRTLHYLTGKAQCYRILADYSSAIAQLTDWLDIVKRNKLSNRYNARDNVIYIDLAELYFENGDYELAEKYAKLSAVSDRKADLLSRLKELNEETIAPEEEAAVEETEDDVMQELNSEEQAEAIRAAYLQYHDTDGFDALNMTDADVAKKLLSFKKNRLYCLLTYAKAATKLSASYTKTRLAENGETVHIGNAIEAIETAFSYAFNSPLSERSYISTDLIPAFEATKALLPEVNEKLFAASALYSIFYNPATPDYSMEDIVLRVNEYADSDGRHPALLPLIERLYQFRTRTGYGMDVFAGYKTDELMIDSIVADAKEQREASNKINEAYEKHGRVRKTRELLFSPKSELIECLDIVAANDTSHCRHVKDTVTELFIRSGRTISAENIDMLKVDEYIDRFWDIARDLLIKEFGRISEPYEKLKGGRRTNIVAKVKKILVCLCNWVETAEYSEGDENAYAKSVYREMSSDVIGHLNQLIQSCEESEKNGFDWGTESILRAATELREKIDGTYDVRNKKYLFIEFLSGEDILLDINYLPELDATFSGWSEFNILRRIERHAAEVLPSFADRISDIFSEIETKHNFRSAVLLKSYGEDMSVTEITEHKSFAQFAECLKQAKPRLESLYHEFMNELDLYESYGSLSNINGEKNALRTLAMEWYRISCQTNDFGFYARLLDVIRNRIALNAKEEGESLLHQLEELSTKTEYDFGVYPKETIEALIKEQNYTVAEYMLNCIRRHDTKMITDYTIEPFGFFNGFMSEHATNYRVAVDVKINLEMAIKKYVGKNNLELAMRHLTGNAMKDVKGGCNLINNWIVRTPAGTDRLEKLLSSLGFLNCTVKTDDSVQEDAYLVYRKKQTGKISYPHPMPAFSSLAEEEGFRVLCLYGKFDCNRLMDMFRSVNTASKHTVVFLDFALNQDERRKLARKIKEEKSFAKTFIVVDRVILLYLAKHYATNTVNKMLMAITMPFAYYQPFVESSNRDMPPELFTGREAELTSIESAEGANLVYGGRQLGKSALLKMAKRNIDKNTNGDRAILLDVKGRHYTDVARIVSGELIMEGILDESCRCDDWDVLAAHLKKRLMVDDPEKRIGFLLLMLDEADEFIRSSGENENRPISALKMLPSNRFKIVMAGLHNLSRYSRKSVSHKNSNLIHLNSIIIRPFKRPEAVKLLTNALAYLGFRFNDNVISLILAKTNYFPGLIQLYCQKLLEAMKNDDYAGYSEISTPSYNVTESHFKKVLSDASFMAKVDEKLESTLFVEESGHSHYHVIALILAYLYYTEPSKKGYTVEKLLSVAENYNIRRITSLERDQLEELLHEMWDLNVLSLEGDCYRFSTEGFREMLGSQYKVDQSMSEYCFGEEADQ